MEQDAGKICPVCNTVIMPNENVRRCPHCGVAYHADCWIKNGGCATPGCPANSATPSAPPQQSAPQPVAPPAPPVGAPVNAAAPAPGPTPAPGPIPAAAPAAFAAPPIPTGVQPAAPAAKAKNPIVAHILGILSGILSIVLGCVCFGMTTGSGYSFETYGGDAYTGIQQAAAQTAQNTAHMADIVRFGFAGLLIVVGVAIIALFLGKIIGREKS